jgi:hypothetical protein
MSTQTQFFILHIFSAFDKKSRIMDDLGVTIQLSTELVDQLRQWNEKPKHAAHHGLSTAGLVPLVPMF